ncbi:hypothetical protein Trydic_g11953 [Trypoxylus dichotomus]
MKNNLKPNFNISRTGRTNNDDRNHHSIISQRKHERNIKVIFNVSEKLSTEILSPENRTSPLLNLGVYEMPCSCGKKDPITLTEKTDSNG